MRGGEAALTCSVTCFGNMGLNESLPASDIIEKHNAHGKMLAYAYKEQTQGVAKSCVSGTTGERALSLKDGVDLF